MKLSRVKLIWQGSPRVMRIATQRIERISEWDGATVRRMSGAVSAKGQEQCILDSCSINPRFQEPRVIIVGAGMAGLSAAHRLTQCGIRNFVILEAKERWVNY